MADWSHLPLDIIQELQSHIESPFSTVRLRSTCSSWRHSIKSNDHNPSTSSFSPLFTKLTFLHLSPPPTPSSSSKPTSWILKIHPQNPQRFHLYYPLSRTRIKLGPNCPTVVLDGLKTRVSELGFEFCYNGSEGLGDCSLYKEKVAFLDAGENYLFLGIHVSGNLAVFSSVFNEWRLVDCLKLVYDDVIVFNGEFYAVDNVGKTVNVAVVNGVDLIDCDVNVVANPICGGDKKRLVEVNGELMLVDVFIGLPPDDDINVVDDGWNVICLDEFVVSRSMWFRVYRLDRGEMSWVEVKDLGKNVLFLGVNSAFCVNADDLYWDKGNCIFFNFPYIFFPSDKDDDDDEVVKYHCGGVYQLEDISVSFPKVFWPPPSWVTSSS